MSYDSPAVLANFAQRRDIRFPLLSDEHSDTIRRWGLLNESIPKTSPFFGVPHPATYIISRTGQVKSVYREQDYSQRYSVGAILARAETQTTRTTEAPQGIRIRTSASDAAVSGGETIRLDVALKLPRSLHVYAPGVQGYIPLSWTMTTEKAKPLDTSFPPSRLLHLKAISETVPVYEREVLLTREVSVLPENQVARWVTPEGKLRLEGTLRYQACDNRQCFVPTELPVSWTFDFERHDRVRVPPELQRQN